MEQLLYGPQAVIEIMQKQEFHFMNKYYSLLYQSLIPNCSLTIKALRQRHLVISDNVEQYILNGGSPRIRCQLLINFLLVNLNDVKDYIQFCNYLDSVSVIGDLSNKLIAEFHDKWKHVVPLHSKFVPCKPVMNTAPKSPYVSSNSQVDNYGASDDGFKLHCVVADDGASADMANKCSVSGDYHVTGRRRFIASLHTTSTKPAVHLVTGTKEATKQDLQKFFCAPISLNLEFMLSSPEWNIVDTFFSPICDCLPLNYLSTIEKLKSFPQFSDAEQQQQLNSLIPASLTDVREINEKILTFLVMNLCYDTNSGGITRLCGVMEQLIEFSESLSCVQEVRCANNNIVSLPSPDQPMDPSHLTSSSDLALLTMDTSSSDDVVATSVPGTGETAIGNDLALSLSEDVTDLSVPGMQLLISRHFEILQCLPMDYENTINLLQNYLTVDQICQILASPSYTMANKMILDCFIEKLKTSLDVSEFCDKLERIVALSSNPEQLRRIIKELRRATSSKGTQDEQEHIDNSEGEMELPELLTVHNDFARLKEHYHTILRLMPKEFEQSIAKLQNYISDDQICTILCCSSHTAANKMLLDCLITRMSCKEDLLDFCDQLEKIVASNDLVVILQEIRSGIHQTNESSSTSDVTFSPEASGILGGDMFNVTFSATSLDPDSKVVAVLKKNYEGLCRCLPDDCSVTLQRIRKLAVVSDGLEKQLVYLSSDQAKAWIITLLLRPLSADTEVLSFCDIMEKTVDSDAAHEFIQSVRFELIEALSSGASSVIPDERYFDKLIFSHMSLDSDSKALAVVKKHCLKLCQCLPQDYMKTIEKIRRRAFVPNGLVQNLANLPSHAQANHHIVAAMLRPLSKDTELFGFCDLFESMVDGELSKSVVQQVRSEIFEALSFTTSVPAVTTAVNVIQPMNVNPSPIASTAQVSTEPSGVSVMPVVVTSDSGTSILSTTAATTDTPK